MSNNIVIAVEKNAVIEQTRNLKYYLHIANGINSNDTFTRINLSIKYLHIAKGIHQVLLSLKVLDDWREVKEDIDRIEAKIEFIRTEKNKHYRPEMRRS